MRDPVEQYEANAEAFYRETRIMAPGKDIPAAMGGYDEHELRAKLWRVWLEKQRMANRLAQQEARIRELEAEKASLLQGRDSERIVSPGAPMRSREQINTNDYRNAPSGVGPLADTWRDKPHRLVYDLCAEVEHCRAHIAASEPVAWDREAVARIVYDAMHDHVLGDSGVSRPWVEGGNSLAQGVARRAADAIKKYAPPSAAGMSKHPLQLREAVNVEDFNRREELIGRIWMLRERVKKDMARLAKWNAAHPDQPISDAFERAMLDYLNGKGPMPKIPDASTGEG